MDDSFVKAPLAVPKLSGFDKSHQNLFTSNVGTITPIMVDELIPGSKVNLEAATSSIHFSFAEAGDIRLEFC